MTAVTSFVGMPIFTPKVRERLKRIDGRYEVSDQGVVYSGGLPLSVINGVGVNLHGERKKIAYLVARAFVPNPESRPYVRHRNGDVTDNRAANLEWCEEAERGKRRGPKSTPRWVVRYNLDGDRLGAYPNCGEASEATGIPAGHIRNCANRRQKTAGGYIWVWL